MQLFKSIQSFVKKNQKSILLVLILVAVSIAVARHFKLIEFFEETGKPVEQEETEQPLAQQVTEMPFDENNENKPAVQAAVEEKVQLQAEDLLPQYDEANQFAEQNPVSKLLKEQNFLVSGYHMGINTIVQSNKIPYHDLRSAPPIPKENVGPFLQSSYEAPAGAGRKQFELM